MPVGLQSIVEFAEKNPDFAIDSGMPMDRQNRIYDCGMLTDLPVELEPSYEFRSRSGRGRPNLNQTLAHFQCKSCRRVLRNDQFYLSPSLMRRNGVSSHCKECTRQLNAKRYSLHADLIRERRYLIWRYLAPNCVVCGFNQHESAMDMHHLGAKENQIATLITDLAFAPSLLKAEKLLHESEHCVPLCSNCHRMIHAGVICLPEESTTRATSAQDILALLDGIRSG